MAVSWALKSLSFEEYFCCTTIWPPAAVKASLKYWRNPSP